MKEDIEDDELMKEIIKGSLLRSPSVHFTEQLMTRIESEQKFRNKAFAYSFMGNYIISGLTCAWLLLVVCLYNIYGFASLEYSRLIADVARSLSSDFNAFVIHLPWAILNQLYPAFIVVATCSLLAAIDLLLVRACK